MNRTVNSNHSLFLPIYFLTVLLCDLNSCLIHLDTCIYLVCYGGRTHARFRWCNIARAQGLEKRNMLSIERSFYLLNTRTICAIFLYNWTNCIDGFSLLLQRYGRKGNINNISYDTYRKIFKQLSWKYTVNSGV